jgi:hypothetical protein
MAKKKEVLIEEQPKQPKLKKTFVLSFDFNGKNNLVDCAGGRYAKGKKELLEFINKSQNTPIFTNIQLQLKAESK